MPRCGRGRTDDDEAKEIIVPVNCLVSGGDEIYDCDNANLIGVWFGVSWTVKREILPCWDPRRMFALDPSLRTLVG